MARYGTITKSILLSGEHKFWKSVKKIPNQCWKWPRWLDKDGYGRFEFCPGDGFTYKLRAHRASYFFKTGNLPPSNIHVCHHCDNPSCVNPGHLFIGTNQDNMDDMNNKDRGRSILSKADVIKIRKLLQSNVKLTYSELAKQFGVNRPSIGDIANYTTWEKIDVGPIPKRSKTDNKDHLKIKELHSKGVSARKIGIIFGISHHTVLSIVINKQ